MSEEEIVQETSFNLEQIQAALETLQRHEVIKKEQDKYIYTVELMRRWVAQRNQNLAKIEVFE